MTAPQARSRTAVPVLGVLLAAALALGGYLWLTTVRWQADSATWEAQARQYADRVAEQRAEISAVEAELVAAREQLATATDRITDLANEKAQLGDRNVVSQQEIDQQTRVSEAAAVVADALDQCIGAQSRLIDALAREDAATPGGGAVTDRFASDVDDLCRQAVDAHDELRRELRGTAP